VCVLLFLVGALAYNEPFFPPPPVTTHEIVIRDERKK
jgi:hypothetical protein